MDREFASRVLAVAKRLDEKNLVNAYEAIFPQKRTESYISRQQERIRHSLQRI